MEVRYKQIHCADEITQQYNLGVDRHLDMLASTKCNGTHALSSISRYIVKQCYFWNLSTGNTYHSLFCTEENNYSFDGILIG